MWTFLIYFLELSLLTFGHTQIRYQVDPYQPIPSASSQPAPRMMALNNDGIGHLHPHHPPNRTPEVICPACLDSRLIQHYAVKGCTPVLLSQCKCPSRFKCPVDVPAVKLKGGHAAGRGHHHLGSQIEGRSMRLTASGDLRSEGCHYNGSHFILGQLVPTANVCRICVCGYHSDGSVGVDCETQIQCPAIRSANRNSPNMWMQNQAGHLVSSFLGRTMGSQMSPVKLNCYDFFEHDKCCPRQECVPVNARTGRTLRSRKTCRYNKRIYQLGEKIDLESMLNEAPDDLEREESAADDDTELLDDETLEENATPRLRRDQFPENFPEEVACLSCICTESWNNSVLEQGRDKLSMELFLQEMGGSCRKKTCEMELDPRFKAGCLPVYHEDKCCPVDFICPRTRYMSMRIRGLDSGSKLCKFEGRKYPVGSMLYQSDHSAAPCVDCECRIPPEFTCLQKKNCIADQLKPAGFGWDKISRNF